MNLRQDSRRIVKLVQDRTIRSVVDIGCGNAKRLIAIHRLFPFPIESIGIDLQFTEDTLVAAQKAGVSLKHGNVETDLDILEKDGQDLILMSQLIRYLHKRQSQ